MNDDAANLPTTTERPPRAAAGPAFPARRAPAGNISQGAVAIESERAIAEAQGKLAIAQRFPRDEGRAFENMKIACGRAAFAEAAIYTFPRGGGPVSGTTIRFAEEMARVWGNIEYGITELSRGEGFSEMEAFAWDLQTNTRSAQRFTVKHLRDRDTGTPTELKSERDKYEITANMGARRLRERILALIPADVKETCEGICRAVIAETVDLKPLVKSFGELGVSVPMLEAKLGKSLADLSGDDKVALRGVFKSIRDGQDTVKGWFAAPEAPKAEPPRDEAGNRKPAALAGLADAVPATAATTAKPEPAKPAEPAKVDAMAEAAQALQDAHDRALAARVEKPAEPIVEKASPAASAAPSAEPAPTAPPAPAAAAPATPAAPPRGTDPDF